jgi:hypothetical protein
VKPANRFLRFVNKLRNAWNVTQISQLTDSFNQINLMKELLGGWLTLFDGAFVLADLLNSGGDFPVERAADVEEDERYY